MEHTSCFVSIYTLVHFQPSPQHGTLPAITKPAVCPTCKDLAFALPIILLVWFCVLISPVFTPQFLQEFKQWLSQSRKVLDEGVVAFKKPQQGFDKSNCCCKTNFEPSGMDPKRQLKLCSGTKTLAADPAIFVRCTVGSPWIGIVCPAHTNNAQLD